MPNLTVIPIAVRVEDQCDYCLRGFARMRGAAAICTSCGLENVRESAMLAPAVETATKKRPTPRRRKAERRSA